MTHFARGGPGSCLVFDEPDIYLHPDLQRRLLRLAQATFCQTLMATHSVEIINECDPSDITLVNPALRRGKKVATDEEYQELLNYLGSADNVEFSRAARARKLIFFEGKDKKLLMRLAAKTGATFPQMADVLVLEAGGFSQWKRVQYVKWTLERVLGTRPGIACLFDKDYRSAAEMEAFECELQSEGIGCRVLKQKELENYIVKLDALVRLVRSKIRQRREAIPDDLEAKIRLALDEESDKFKLQVQSQLTAHATRYAKELRDHRDESTIIREVLAGVADAWIDLDRRLCLVPGKELISALSNRFQTLWQVSISPVSLASEIALNELDRELIDILGALELFATGPTQPERLHATAL